MDSSPPLSPPAGAASTDAPKRLLVCVAILGGLLVLAQRLWLLQNQPLWFDETWTAMIAQRPSWPAFLAEAGLEANAPLYYLVMYLWEPIGQLSNDALRIPSLVFVIAAALAPLVWRVPGVSRQAALTWGMLLFFWKAGIPASIDARGYTLLLLISVLQTIAFARLIHRPSLKAAAIWCALGSAAFATHYLSAYITAAEGLIYLGLHRKKAASTWPALAFFAPSFGWVAAHRDRLSELSQSVAEWPPLDLNGTATALGWLIYWENWPVALLLAAILGVGLHVLSRGEPGGAEREPRQDHLLWTLAAGAAALAAALFVGSQSATILPRYLTPLVPIVMLGLTLLAGRGARPTKAYIFLLGIFAIFALAPGEHRQVIAKRSHFGFHPSIDYLRAADPGRVVLAMDTNYIQLLKPATVQQLIDTSFGGSGVELILVDVRKSENPFDRLIEHASRNEAAIIWMRGSKSAPYGSDIAKAYPDWACRNPLGPHDRFVSCAPKAWMR